MSNDLKLGESGKVLVVGSNGFNMASNSELRLTFKKSDGETIVEKTKTGGEVFLGVADITVDDVSLSANEYVEYPIEIGFLDQYGDWCMYLTYEDTDASPNQIFKGLNVKIPVANDECDC